MLDRRFTEDNEIAGRHITQAVDVPSEDEIFEAARILCCTFDPSYIEFLQRYGGAMVGSLPIYGLRPVNVMGNRWSVVDVTQWFRHEGWPGVSEWYVISEDGFGNPIGIAPDGQVMIADHDVGQLSVLTSNFEEFLVKQCSNES